jgi:hypothetical protein
VAASFRDMSETQLVAWRQRQQQRAQTTAPPQPQAAQELKAHPCAALLGVIEQLVRAHGWTARYSYNTDGPDSGLHCQFVREVVVWAEIPLNGVTLAPDQQQWVEALRRAAGSEVYTWTLHDLPTLRARLSQPRASS